MTGDHPVCDREEGMGLEMLMSLVVSFLWWRGLMKVRTRVLIQVSRRAMVNEWMVLLLIEESMKFSKVRSSSEGSDCLSRRLIVLKE